MTEQVLIALDAAKRGLERVQDHIGITTSTEEIPNPGAVLSNATLLFRVLRGFYSDPKKAAFLPAFITRNVFSSLSAINSLLEPISVSADDPSAIPPEVAEPLLRGLDQLYATCLQYGVISFGFDSKVADDTLREVRSRVAAAQSAVGDVEAEIQELLLKVVQSTDSILQATTDAHSRFDEAMQQKLGAAESQLQSIKDQATSVEAEVQTIQQHLLDVQKMANESTGVKDQLTQTVNDIAVQRATAFASSDEALRNSQSAESQINDLSANAKAQLQNITDAKASITLQLEDITKFYADIEKHKQEMLDLRKEMAATAANLTASTDQRLSDYSTRTETVVKTNQELIGQIRDHLRKAVGITLFTAFDERRGRIFWGSVVWAVLLGLSTLGAIGFALWFVHSLSSTKLDPSMLYARLIIAAPIAFLIGFAAKQYSRERRAEEEYAFKSAISVSLDSYRELIDRIRKENPGADTDFVRQLVLEIFDNPAKRLYAVAGKGKKEDEPTETEAPNILETVNKLVDTVGKLASKFQGPPGTE